MTAVDAPTLLAEVEQRIAVLAAPTGQHPVQVAAQHAVGGGKLLRPRLVVAAAGEGADRDAVRRLVTEGPPAEEVGLEPYLIGMPTVGAP